MPSGPTKYRPHWGWTLLVAIVLVGVVVLAVAYQAIVPPQRRPPPNWDVIDGH